MPKNAPVSMVLPDAPGGNRLEGNRAITKWARRYPKLDFDKDNWIQDRIRTSLESSRCLDLEDVKRLGVWTNGSERSSGLFKRNTPAEIKRRTGEAYESHSIEPIMQLEGFRTGFPMASSFMHFAFDNEFPIIDSRALSTLGVPEKTHISKRVWTLYCDKCRSWADYYQVSLRELDRALWQFNVEDSFWKRVRLMETRAAQDDRGCGSDVNRA